jgi:hypothetical protein
MQLRQAASPCPDVPAQAAKALATFPHSDDDAAANAGATAGGNVSADVKVGGWAAGLVGKDGIGSEYGQPKKQSDPQLHVSKASMNGPQVSPHVYSHVSIQSQIVDVSCPHVGSPMKAKLVYRSWHSAHALPSRLLSLMHPAHAEISDEQADAAADAGAGADVGATLICASHLLVLKVKRQRKREDNTTARRRLPAATTFDGGLRPSNRIMVAVVPCRIVRTRFEPASERDKCRCFGTLERLVRSLAETGRGDPPRPNGSLSWLARDERQVCDVVDPMQVAMAFNHE